MRKTSGRGRIGRALAGVTAAALVAAACGGSDDADDDTSDDSSGSTEVSASDAPEGAADDDAGDESASDDASTDDEPAPSDDADSDDDGETDESPDDESTGDESSGDDPVDEESAEDVERIDSFRGITEDTIRVGVLDYDWDRLADLGVDFGVTTSVDLFRASLERVNDAGGLAGRQLEIVEKVFLPVGDAEATQVCIELAEDEEVFMVVGRLRDDQVLCFTEQYDTAAFVPLGMTDERVERSTAPYASLSGRSELRIVNFVDAMEATGAFEGATIGVTGTADANEANYEIVVAALEERGYEPVGVLVGGSGDDLGETARTQEVAYERLEAAGVDVVITTSGVALELFNAFELNFEPDQWMFATAITGRAFADAGVPWEFVDGALSATISPVGTSLQPGLADDPATAECVDDLVARTDAGVVYDLDAEVNDLTTALFACGLAEIVEAAFDGAGPNPTNESLQEGIEAIGTIELPAYGTATFGPGDQGGVDEVFTVRFDSATGVYDVVE
ncbi:MAG: hypothetical protein AAF945_05400 [Actinomycetota bacterium]